MKIIYLTWKDSANVTGWEPQKRIGGLSIIETVGFLLYEDKERIDIVHSNHIDNEEYLGILSIPKGAIIKRRFLKGQP